MARLDFAQLRAQSVEMDRAALATPGVDAFCSSSAWVFSAQAAFSPEARPFAAREGEAWAVMMRVSVRPGSWVAVPLEAGWGLAAPLLGPDPGHSAAVLGRLWEASAKAYPPYDDYQAKTSRKIPVFLAEPV